MKVTIKDPNTAKGMYSGLTLDFTCYFIHDAETYGNGYYVNIVPNERSYDGQMIDLRYDKTFDRNNKSKWIEKWAKSYWTGENGAWALDTLEIEKVK